MINDFLCSSRCWWRQVTVPPIWKAHCKHTHSRMYSQRAHHDHLLWGYCWWTTWLLHNALPVEHVVCQRLQLLKDGRGEHPADIYMVLSGLGPASLCHTRFFPLHVTTVSDHMIQTRTLLLHTAKRFYQDPTKTKACRQMVIFTHVLLEILID